MAAPESPGAPVRVRLVEDGGNPRSPEAVRRKRGGFRIAPFSEDGDPNYKFRLDVELVNDSPGPVTAAFTIDWDDEAYGRYRRYVLLARGEAWQRHPAALEGRCAAARVPVPPGRSRLGMHPPYGVGRLARLVAGLDRGLFRVRAIGRSRRGRDILAIEAGPPGRRPLVLQARVHPYESVGSFMLEGMIRWLDAGGQEARALLAGRRLAFLPMPNPDGVAEGTCKRTLGGLDLNEAAASAEPEGVALTAFYRRVRPRSSFDIHGFMHDSDGFGTGDIERGRAIHAALSARPEVFDKKLTVRHRGRPEGGLANPGAMAEHEFGSVRFGGAFAWYDRDAAHVRRMGVELLRAYAARF